MESSFLWEVVRFLVLRLIVRPLDYLLDTLQGYYDGRKSNPYLEGNYAPVTKEHTKFNLPITHGKIPECLTGEFVRNGPNPISVPQGGYHWFDGSGMIHGVRMNKDGTVSYVNRFTKTKLLLEEERMEMRLTTRLGELHGKIGLVKVLFQNLKRKLHLTSGLGSTANTALVFHNNKLQALLEADVPYEIRVFNDGQFETAARLDYGGKIDRMTAHPKVDPVTNELFFFSYTLGVNHIVYGYADPKGNIVRTMPISLPDSIMMHDFAITERHALFLDMNLVFKPKNIIKGEALVYDPTHVPRVGILNRYAKNSDDIVWFKVAACEVFHTANAWEEGDEVVLITCRSVRQFEMGHVLGSHFELVEWRFNMKTLTHAETLLTPGTFAEFPQINPSLLGKKNKYVFLATKNESITLTGFHGIIKVNVETKKIEKQFAYGDRKCGGEPVFVPKPNATSEDDGYLLGFVHDEIKDVSSFWVIDAKNLTDIVAIVDLPARVPFGFHGLFLSEADIQSQLLY